MLKALAKVFNGVKATDVTFLYPMPILSKLSILWVDAAQKVAVFHFFIELL